MSVRAVIGQGPVTVFAIMPMLGSRGHHIFMPMLTGSAHVSVCLGSAGGLVVNTSVGLERKRRLGRRENRRAKND